MSRSTVAETLGIHLRKEIIAEIEARGDAIDKKKGTYAALILEKWFADGCPPVTEADRLMQASKKAAGPKQIKSATKLDPWNLDPTAAYYLVDDAVVKSLMIQLRVPNLFAEHAQLKAFEAFVTFDNHPTHWITISLFKGHGNKRDDGLSFVAQPKNSTPRYEIEREYRERAAKVGQEIRGPVRLSQIPEEIEVRS
jgi:hypothetical protein